MKRQLTISLITITTLLATLTPSAFAEELFPKGPFNLTVRLQMFSMPQAMVDEFLSKPELKSQPNAALAALAKSVTEKKARIYANPVVASQSGYTAKVEGKVAAEINAVFTAAGVEAKLLHLAVTMSSGEGGKLTSKLEVHLNEPRFLGVLDVPVAQGTGTEPCLVFVSIQ